jgi:hypothetical protein
MDHNDRQAIEGLFGKLSETSRAQPHRNSAFSISPILSSDGECGGRG